MAPDEIVEFVAGPLRQAVAARSSGGIDLTAGVAGTAEMGVLVSQRLADVALGPNLSGDRDLGLVSDPVFRARLVVLTAVGGPPPGPPAHWPWLLSPSGTDLGSAAARLLRRLGVPSHGCRCSPTRPPPGTRPCAVAGWPPGCSTWLRTSSGAAS